MKLRMVVNILRALSFKWHSIKVNMKQAKPKYGKKRLFSQQN